MRKSVSSTIIAAIIVIIIIIAGIGGYLYYTSITKPTTRVSHVAKIAVLLPYVTNDFGWNQDMYQAITQIGQVYHVNYTVDANLGYSTSAVESALEYYASNGYNIIIAWTNSWQQAILTVAPNYPNTWFIDSDLSNFTNPSTGQPEKNVISIATDVPMAYGAYVAGVLAAYLTKTGIIGFQAGYSYPSMNTIGNAFLAGARSVNPNIKLVYDFPGSWGDVEKGYVGAQSLIAAGADVILFRGDGQTLGGEQACAAAGVYAIGDMLNQSSINPNVIVASNMYNDTLVLQSILQRFNNNTLSEWADKNVYIPGVAFLLLGPKVSSLLTPQQLHYVEQIDQGVINGSIKVPINYTLPPSGAV
jgi:basic membrane protein A